MKKLLIVILLSISFVASAQQLNIALLKYRGGGDWYGNPTSLPNLVRFCNQEIGTDINPNVPTVEPSSPDLFNYPYVYLTGHGNVVFDAAEAQNLRNYMLAGGFLHIDDNYGIRQYIEPQMKRCSLSWISWNCLIRMRFSKSPIRSRMACQKFTSTTTNRLNSSL